MTNFLFSSLPGVSLKAGTLPDNETNDCEYPDIILKMKMVFQAAVFSAQQIENSDDLDEVDSYLNEIISKNDLLEKNVYFQVFFLMAGIIY